MKKDIQLILSIIITGLIIYSIGVFLTNQWDITKWSAIAKVVFLIFLLLGIRGNLEEQKMNWIDVRVSKPEVGLEVEVLTVYLYTDVAIWDGNRWLNKGDESEVISWRLKK